MAKSSVLGGNLFSYCGNNAVNASDPTGEWVEKSSDSKSTESSSPVESTEYDSSGNTLNVSTVTYSDGSVSVTKTNNEGKEVYYEADGEITITTYANEIATSTTYKSDDMSTPIQVSKKDSNGREIYNSADGVEKNYGYFGDTENTTSESTTVGGLTLKTFTEYTSDSAGNKVTISTDSAGNITNTVTNAINGLTLSSTDGNQSTTSYTYDELQNLTALLNNDTNIKTAYTYEHGNIKTITTNAEGTSHVVYSFNYDGFGNILSIKVGTVELVTYTYNHVTHNPLTITYANGTILSYEYGDNGTLNKQSCGTTLNENYTYDELGNVIKTTDNVNNTVTVTVDGETQVWNKAETTLLHSYESSDTAFSETVGNSTYSTAYASNDATSTEQANTVTTYDGKTQTTYTDKFGRTSQIVTKNGDSVVMTQAYTYTEHTKDGQTLTSEQVKSISTTIGSTTTNETTTIESYVYDDNGNILKVKRDETLVSEYVYDELNQLTDEYNYSNLTRKNYSYDNNGNIRAVINFTLSTDSNGLITSNYVNVESYSYADSNWADKATSANGEAISYDAQGNPTSYNGYTLSWKNGRQLASAAKGSVSTSYSYDSNGIRNAKTISDSANYTGESHSYTTVDGRITSDTISKGGMGLYGTDGKLYFRYNSANSLVGFDVNYTDNDNNVTINGSYSYLKNLVGDVVGIVDNATKAQVVSYTYDAWGNVTSITGNQTLGTLNPMRYKGYYLDSDTGMYYLQSRYYDPSLRRFINADAAELISDLAKSSVLGGNLFAYCENNGVVSSDESGNSSILQKVLGILKNAVSTIRYILDVIIGCVSRELKSLMKPLYLMTRKNINAKKILTPLKKALSKLNNKLRIVAISLALLTCIAIIASAWRCSNNIKYTMAVIISEIFVMFMCWGIVFLASCLCKLIPYVGFIISIFVSVIGGAVIWLYFNTRRTNVIKNAIYNLLKKTKRKLPIFSILKVCFQNCV